MHVSQYYKFVCDSRREAKKNIYDRNRFPITVQFLWGKNNRTEKYKRLRSIVLLKFFSFIQIYGTNIA